MFGFNEILIVVNIKYKDLEYFDGSDKRKHKNSTFFSDVNEGIFAIEFVCRAIKSFVS